MRLHALLLLALAVGHTTAALNYPRQRPGAGGGAGGTGDDDGSSSSSSSSTTTTTTTTSTSTTTTSTSTTSTTTSTTSTTSTSTTSTTTDPTTTTTSTTPTPPPNTSTTPLPQTPTTNIVTKTEENGEVVTVTSTGTIAPPAETSKTTTKDEAKNEGDDSPGLGLGAIVGMSVAGGLAVLGIIAFFIWKFTRKRSSFDDNEAIKWPDLNSHSGAGLDSHPLPARETARTGFGDTGSEVNGSLMNSDNYSTADFSAQSHDPYAVPPLPHLNPNQPYRDDPSAVYDPYRGPGPVPDGSDWHGEAIPMSQLHGGPPAAYDQVGYEQPGYNNGRASPGPNMAYQQGGYVDGAGRQSPGPHMAYQAQGGYPDPAGRQSPGPQQAFGGRMSPGPNMAYNNGYPQAGAPGYDAYGPR